MWSRVEVVDMEVEDKPNVVVVGGDEDMDGEDRWWEEEDNVVMDRQMNTRDREMKQGKPRKVVEGKKLQMVVVDKKKDVVQNIGGLGDLVLPYMAVLMEHSLKLVSAKMIQTHSNINYV